MPAELPRLVTIGVIAERLKVPVHRVSRVLSTRPHIQPRAMAGRVRLYDETTIAMVRHELNTIDARTARGAGLPAEAGNV